MSKSAANLIDTRTAAALLEITPRWLQKLARDGWIKPAGRGQWPLATTIQGYIVFLQSRIQERPAGAALHDARAKEIEQRLARQDRSLVTMDEALASISEITNDMVSSVEGLPRKITKDPRERERITAICSAEAARLKMSFAASKAALKTGMAIDDSTDEE
ncbi:hypothetical protein NKJ66_07325 [Mesorhizobium sp. M0078]|uniref:hypothetical protein n=1 Tax=Mesorhizobium sp. M0078 TaxID=2956871 RepID=UPI00333D6D8A